MCYFATADCVTLLCKGITDYFMVSCLTGKKKTKNICTYYVVLHFAPKLNSTPYFHQQALNKSVQIVFDFVFWVTHLVRAEQKVYSPPYGTCAAGPSEHTAA